MFDYYIDMIETARRALQRRDAAQRTFEESLPTHRSAAWKDRRMEPKANKNRRDSDEGPETWPGLFA